MERTNREKPSAPLTVPQILDPKDFPVGSQHLSNSCYFFGVMVMKDSNGVRNGEEEIERHSKYDLDFVD